MADSKISALTEATSLTDTDELVIATAGASKKIGADTMHGYIAETTVGAGGAVNIDFTSIPGTYRHLRLEGAAQTESATVDYLTLRFNNDSGTNYYSQLLLASNTTVSGQEEAAVSDGRIATLPDTAETQPVHFTIDVPFYASTVFRKVALSKFGGYYDSANRIGTGSLLWTNAAAVTRITVLTDSGSDLKEGTRISLYGIV